MAPPPPAPPPGQARTVRVLIAGDVHGKLGSLFERATAAGAKAGPFDVLLCVGGFFPQSSAWAGVEGWVGGGGLGGGGVGGVVLRSPPPPPPPLLPTAQPNPTPFAVPPTQARAPARRSVAVNAGFLGSGPNLVSPKSGGGGWRAGWYTGRAPPATPPASSRRPTARSHPPPPPLLLILRS